MRGCGLTLASTPHIDGFQPLYLENLISKHYGWIAPERGPLVLTARLEMKWRIQRLDDALIGIPNNFSDFLKVTNHREAFQPTAD